MRQQQVTGLEVVGLALVVGVVVFFIGRALFVPDTTQLAGELVAPCTAFPTSQQVRVEGIGGKELGTGLSATPMRVDSARCSAAYSAEVEQADQYRIILGPLRSALVSRGATTAVVLAA